MNAEDLYQSLKGTSLKNLKLLQLVKNKVVVQTRQVLQAYNKLEVQKEKQLRLQQSYEDLLKLSKQSKAQNQRIQQSIQANKLLIMKLQEQKRQRQTDLSKKKQRLSQMSKQVSDRKQQQDKSQGIQAQNSLLQTRILQLLQSKKMQEEMKKQLRIQASLLKNQQLLIQAQKQNLETQYLTYSSQRFRAIDQLQKQLQQAKRETIAMKHRMTQQEEQTNKRNKAETLSEIRQMIRKHRERTRESKHFSET